MIWVFAGLAAAAVAVWFVVRRHQSASSSPYVTRARTGDHVAPPAPAPALPPLELELELEPAAEPAPLQITIAPAKKAKGQEPERVVAPPKNTKGLELERAFRTQLAKGADVTRDVLHASARAAADALIAEQELRRAAGVLNDAGLVVDAIHLYGVLGEPHLAAPILIRTGEYERAAELYELAGDFERAASAWSESSTGAREPLAMYERIERLSPVTARKFLTARVSQRALSAETAPLYYLQAQLLEHTDAQAAQYLYAQITKTLGAFRDVEARMAALAAGKPIRDRPHRAESQPIRVEPENNSYVELTKVKALAEQLAKAVGAHLARPDVDLAVAGETVKRPAAVGLEGASVKIGLLYDAVVRAARGGSPVDTYLRTINRRPCDLGNIEAYYRLGLAHLAIGKFGPAKGAFERVDEASPGYRDAAKRVKAIEDWMKAIGARGQVGKRYSIQGELGRGSCAVVYRAKDAVLGKDVALKFLSLTQSSDFGVTKVFEREAQAAATLEHANIVRVYDVGRFDSRSYLAMELVEGPGCSLDILREQPSGLSIVESLRAVKQVIDALEYAHERKIVHGSIEPANVMRLPSGLVKVTDFGLARVNAAAHNVSSIAGTPELLSPEQLRAEEIDARTDVFSTAATLYLLLANKPPFEGTDRTVPPRPLSDHVTDLPEIVVDPVMRGLALDRARRPVLGELRSPIMKVLEAVSRVSGEYASDPVPAGASGELKLTFR